MHTRRVTVVPYDPAWPGDFARLCAALAPALDGLASGVEHVGSTSVPALWAKPIIDLDVVLPDMDVFPALCARLAALGFAHEGDLGIAGREAFSYDGREPLPAHHLYVCPANSPELRRHTVFRDYLRAHPEAVRAYSAAKREAAALYPHNIDAYIAHKTPCIQALYRACGLEPSPGNPWLSIALADYEGHMKQDSVGQLSALRAMMAGQFSSAPARSVMILGVAGGNGLEQLRPGQFQRVYGVDINAAYLDECTARCARLPEFVPVQADLCCPALRLPAAELLIADLIVEYIGCGALAKAAALTGAAYVSCVIQRSGSDGFVSPSAYAHAFDALGAVHQDIREDELTQALTPLGFTRRLRQEAPLPGGKALLRLDYSR
ncbi:MAG: GrpB family protein [Eubacteriales bacterium]|nr:GrpB family protein [Eubacteriales bacterium]